ncbi:MAG: hypothetical protein AMK70_04240 [Nitrospira bacterium SG8_35_1]|nr:MAG: hypothetical protein AMK70_04240 [Nitrospira bacterium SG8_35_1]
MQLIALSMQDYPENYLDERELREGRKFEIADNIEELKKQIEMIDALLKGAAMPESMTDADFLTAEEKIKILKEWEGFVQSGFLLERFTRNIYEHLHLHCGYIAHYDKGGYYYTYWNDEILRSAAKNGCALSPVPGVFYEWKSFLKQFTVRGEYRDINTAMMCILRAELVRVTDKLHHEIKTMYTYETRKAHVSLLKELDIMQSNVQSLEEEITDLRSNLLNLTPEKYLNVMHSDYSDLFGDEFIEQAVHESTVR